MNNLKETLFIILTYMANSFVPCQAMKQALSPQKQAELDRKLVDQFSCSEVSLESIKKLVEEEGANVDAVVNMDDEEYPVYLNPLCGIACLADHDHSELDKLIGITKYLLDQGARVDTPCLDGTPPLDYATSKGCLEMVKLLLERGADINAQNGGGKTVLDSAISFKAQLKTWGHIDQLKAVTKTIGYLEENGAKTSEELN